MPVSKESEPAWCCGPILSSSSCSATSCSPPWKQNTSQSVKIHASSQRRTWRPPSQEIATKKLWINKTGDTLCYRLEYLFTYLQVFTALHEVLDIINDWKVQAKNLKEVHLLLRQVSVGQNLDQVSKVIATAKHIYINTCTAFNFVFKVHTAGGFKRFLSLPICHDTKTIKDRMTGFLFLMPVPACPCVKCTRLLHMRGQITTQSHGIIPKDSMTWNYY